MTSSLALRHISKRFGPTIALGDVSFAARVGEVHALLGENGAGKSTLMQIAYGMIRPDSGTIVIDAVGSAALEVPALTSPRQARAAGIGMVHQHFTSIPALTVSENIALSAGWRETGRAAERRADALVDRLGLPLPVSAAVEGMSVQLRQRLEIVKALAADARILLLDEPSAVLAPREVAGLLEFIRTFAASGGTVVLITHKLDEVFQVADRVTVLRRGEVVLSDHLAAQTPQSLSRAMIGAELSRTNRPTVSAGEILVSADGVRLRAGGPAATFDLRAGEIVGIAAIEGNGQRELLRAIAGVDDVALAGGAVHVRGPVAFIPEDRSTEGIIPSFTLTENSLLGSSVLAHRWLDWGAIRRRTGEMLMTHDVRAAGPDVAAATLSGGNQQKFIFARALADSPRVIVAEDPTRGLDLLAAQAIHERLRQAARNGAAVIVHSSDLDEVLEIGDRLLVVARGEVTELAAHSPRDVVGDAMLGLAAAS